MSTGTTSSGGAAPHTAAPRPGPADPAADSAGTGLRQGLKRRHMRLIALGGVIGAGLFVGSGVVIRSTGPAAVVSFLAAGVLTVLIMRMLAEMTVARPALGSFYAHVRETLGHRAGFAVGWLYWYFFVVVVAVEAVAGGRIIRLWLPGVPLWAVSLVLLTLLTATNLVSARSYGEFEYWFSSIKVVAIVVFLFLGALFVLGLWPGSGGGLDRLTAHGGFAPAGAGAVLAAVVPCVGFFTGTEIVTIAAAESVEPERAVANAIRSIVLRVVAFYVLSVLVVVAVVPWTSKAIEVSPYAAVLDRLAVPAAGTVMNAIVLVAVLSCLNSALYTSSRMLFALTRNGDAPRGLTKVGASGVPRRALLAGTSVGYLSVLAAWLSPDVVFSFLINSYGAIALFVYLAIAVTQLRMRRRLERTEPARLTLRMWGFPWLSRLTVALMALVIGAMAVLPDSRAQFWLSLLTLGVVLAAYEIRRRVRRK
ncbi:MULTISPECIES: amino acid permease [unclassified Streptomyces]|uniref:amino acid permease n=1 Tax=unclassified Streptomyces TaxID=2593676 RepID=UPI00037E0434|nr:MULTISPECIES: amino acid permease [unclassified Streptomyces]MYT34247.1 amino acid permease [Streptomyces sp. SID8354]